MTALTNSVAVGDITMSRKCDLDLPSNLCHPSGGFLSLLTDNSKGHRFTTVLTAFGTFREPMPKNLNDLRIENENV
jgi:hypothetical protein